MIPRGSWAKERTLGVAGVTIAVVGWGMLLYVQTLPSVCAVSVGLLSWPLLLISLASPVAILWAVIKDKWCWVIGLIPAILLLLSVLGTFEGC